MAAGRGGKQEGDKVKFRNFLGVKNKTYFKEGVELLYPSIKGKLTLAILPAYDPDATSSIGWLPAVKGDEENDFYTTVRAAKFVGHGNRLVKTSFLSPRTFDLDADDPYDAFYDYCSRSDKWSYLTKDKRGRSLTGEVEGAIFPKMNNLFVANVMDVTAGSRGGVFVVVLPETVAKNILYSLRKNGQRIDGLAFERDSNGKLVFGDITDPKSALVIEVVYNGKSYVARPALNRGDVMRVEIPEVLLQHRHHMEEPRTFLIHPGSGQAIVDKLAGMLRGYKSEDGTDEIEALKEAMQFAYSDKYVVDEEAQEVPDDPFGDAATTVSAEPDEKAQTVAEAVDRGVAHEQYTPPINPPEPKRKKAKGKEEPKPMPAKPVGPVEPAPGEAIDPSDIANVRAMLLGGE